MLKSAMEAETSTRPEIIKLIDRLQSDGRRWAMAESELAKIEMDELKNKAIRVVSFAIVSIAAIFCALAAFTQAGIAFLTPYVDSFGLAALIIGGILVMLVVASILVIRSTLTWRAESIVFRWLTRRSDAGA